MFRAAIVCMSDKGYRGKREDISSNVIEEILLENNYTTVSYTHLTLPTT